MNETARAKQAFNDYVVLGADRSLANLLKVYQNQPHPPTRHIATLKDWSVAFDWQLRLTEIAETERRAIVAKGIADKQNRIDAANERWQELRQAVASWRTEYQAAPGGAKSGYYARKVAVVKVHGEVETDKKGRGHFVPTGDLIEVEEWVLDTGLLKELREHEKQVAIELGQWTEKREDTLNASESFIDALREFGRADT